MSNYTLRPSDEPEDKVYDIIRREFEKNSVSADTLKLRYGALCIIVEKSSIEHPISTVDIYNALKAEYMPEGSLGTIECITPTLANLQRGLSSYIGRTRVRTGRGKDRRFNAAYFFRIGKNSENADLRNEAEIIQKRFLGVLGECKGRYSS